MQASHDAAPDVHGGGATAMEHTTVSRTPPQPMYYIADRAWQRAHVLTGLATPAYTLLLLARTEGRDQQYRATIV